MTKTNTRSRIVSILLVLVMLVSLMPSLAVPAHAFWDDYDTGGFCPNCDHYHWAENCCDCQFCTAANRQHRARAMEFSTPAGAPTAARQGS